MINKIKSWPRNLIWPLLLSIILLIIMYHKVFYKMVLQWWNDPNYSHGFVIIPISVYWLWIKKEELQKVELRPSLLGIIILVFAGVLFLVGQIAGELFSQRISLVILLIGLIFSYGGRPLWKIVWLPVCYLIFMVPLPYIFYDSIAFPLKLVATKISTEILQTLGVSIFSEGNVIYLPNTTLEVADACSGIRSLLSILSLSVIIAFITQNKTWKKIALIMFSIPVVLFCNIIRIVVTGLLASQDPNLSIGFFHAFSGELIFILGVIIIFVVSRLLARTDNYEVLEKHVSPLNKTPSEEYSIKLTIPWASLIILSCFFVLSIQSNNVKATPLTRPLARFPTKVDGFYKVADDRLNDKILNILGVDDYLLRTFHGPGGYPLTLYIGYFEDQKEGAMIHSPKHCYPGSGWFPVSSKTIEVRLPPAGRKVKINEYLLTKKGGSMLVYYWYQSRGRIIANEYEDRAYMILDSVVRRRSDGALIRISGPAENVKQARELQLRFIRKLLTILPNFLPS